RPRQPRACRTLAELETTRCPSHDLAPIVAARCLAARHARAGPVRLRRDASARARAGAERLFVGSGVCLRSARPAGPGMAVAGAPPAATEFPGLPPHPPEPFH